MKKQFFRVTGAGVTAWLFAITASAQAPADVANQQANEPSEPAAPEPPPAEPAAAEPAPSAAPPAAEGQKSEAAAPTEAAAAAAVTAAPAAGTVFQTPEGWPVTVAAGANEHILFYGFAELDVMHDSTQSFPNDGSNNASIARPGTVAGDNGQMQFTARNSRFGIKLETSEYHGMKGLAQAELDFYGNQSPTASEGAIYTNAPVRMRHYFLTLKTPVIDVLAGQYHDLFGWGGNGFFPNTNAFLGLPGEIYHRNPQVRLTKTFKSEAIDFEIAAAAVRPVGRAGEVPDGQAGLRVALNKWKGVRAQGSGPPDAGPLSLGVSGVGRRFRVNPFSSVIGDYKTATGWGVAADLVAPIIPCTKEDMSNAVTVTGEFTLGSGISDLYSGLSGGARYPALPNPLLQNPAPVYSANLDAGIVAFDDGGNQANIHPINWRGLVAGAQYHLPFAMGKLLWLSGVFAMVQSTNLESLTPAAAKGTIWTKAQYFDGNLFVGVTPAIQLDLSYQVSQQTYADTDPATGDNVKATNNRAEFAMHYFF